MNNESVKLAHLSSAKNKDRLVQLLSKIEKNFYELKVVLSSEESLYSIESLDGAYDLGFVEGIKTVELLNTKNLNFDEAIKSVELLKKINLKREFDVWLEKTQWVQDTAQSHELGMHRADVLRKRIEALEKKTQRAWVGLADYDRIELLASTHPNNRWPLLELCEAKLKEKNT